MLKHNKQTKYQGNGQCKYEAGIDLFLIKWIKKIHEAGTDLLPYL
jgi:hypothetical protein